MSKRYNHYHIKIVFDKRRSNCNTGSINASYLNGGINEDEFIFSSSEVVIIASRANKFQDGTILSKNQNSIYIQILKALLYYYSLAADFPKINNVEIIRKQARLGEYSYTECRSNMIQPIISNHSNSRELMLYDKNKIKVLFDESEKGNAIRIALSYWLKGISSNERYYKFEHLWRAYNRLFMYHGNLPKEVDCMAEMRELIIRNEHVFIKTKAITNLYTDDILRSFRWRSLILNDYGTLKKTGAFSNFILRYHDHRIMNLFNSVLPYRCDYLTRESLINNVRSHISQNLSTNCDAELVTLLSLKYSYFVRNKMFHGEIPDSTFKLFETNEDIEIDRINNLLTALVFELINNNEILR